MKKKLLNLLLNTSKKLEQLHFKLSKKNILELDYSSLSPINNGDEKNHYSNALKWAIDNRKEKDIKNIALTGTYGSGKSTIIKTFKNNYKGNDLKFLNISLASFKDEKPNTNDKNTDDKDKPIEKNKGELLNRIETSILQQIFYHEEDKKIPDSRFKQIKNYSNGKLFFIASSILLFLIALVNYFKPYLIQSIFKDYPLSTTTCNILHYANIIFIFSGFFFLIYKSIRIFSAITINKLKFQNAEIGLGESVNKSILNHHLDEIIYFFTVTTYNVVIIEDLDRFQETEIFTKLREINLLLNESKKIKNKNIVFIYAVRDDMFSDTERIKFFDFIIPVIPRINSSNSSAILLTKNKNCNYGLTDNFIEDISFFIDDMRLLHNITNEFYLYKLKQEETPLIPDKLFAIITYKNIYPNDFVTLSKNEGELYKIIDAKLTYSNKEIDNLEKQITILKSEIENLSLVNINNINELRQLYIIRILDKLKNYSSFKINNKTVYFNDLLKDENFEYIKRDEIYYDYNYQTPISFSQIESKVNPGKPYNIREQEILDIKSNKSDALRLEIQQLEKQKIKLRNLKISELLQSNRNIDLNISEDFNSLFLTILLRNGYIAEDYFDYISLFHEGSVTRNDHKFIINVRNEQKLDFNYKLTKIDEIISKINPIDFNSEFILNYDLLDFILKNAIANEKQLDFIFTKLKDESSTSIQFINDFIERTENLSLFIKTLCDYWVNIWEHYVNNISYSDEQLNKILKYIIEFANISSIKEIEKQSKIQNHLLNNLDFLNIISDNNKLKSVITQLDLKFIDLDFENSPENLLDFIYKNDHYEFNKNIVSKFIKKYGKFEQMSFDNSNYTAIKNSKANNLISYINTNIDNYVKNLYLDIDTNINEEQNTYLLLLNNSELNLKLKKDIIKKVTTKIIDISLVENNDLALFILENNKIKPKWDNLLFYFKNSGDKILDSTVNFINNIENTRELSIVKIPTEVKSENIYDIFCEELINKNEIEDKAYDLITKSTPWGYTLPNISTLNEQKISSLIRNSIFTPNIENYNYLKEKFEGLNIELIEKFKTEFLEKIDKLHLNGNDLALILNSKILNDSEKIKFLESCSDNIIISNLKNLNLIGQLLLKDYSFDIDKKIIDKILLSDNISSSDRIKIFNKNIFDVDTIFIDEFLIKLGSKYEEITFKNKKAKILNTSNHRDLLNNLIGKNYISSFSRDNLRTMLIVNHKRK
ncbi:hypothetical protein J2Q11_06595 [Tenacibaculum finnmarkense genomovar finnmarkense]|uniref:YobI family P-loop NTPase n=2 Tax=Tenacibaculum finnmarkense TaxID=2781243 RepID=UPI001E5C66CC|nr:hypothetical protein [Tenacibaculum finnmarkense]MCD8417372.1 hypothetical protein [Tenacibaculum finnmarkense genomovar finnmarkense]MCG8185733.1 hypothetical protein [Tenacibaculum finnmarkense genomovar finnmarkense]MCG8202286.1 hypothetical protein [Tenacibaculum finnmarkense genomovar finnmarkense]MCG8209710.1 hypothetical protein [Tenacibaculum finnmarkense genomovar finnmarkense]MCG8212486.1 hypothetical protein [Tenacibaculum finnmarkense genomovar finnmarkense]